MGNYIRVAVASRTLGVSAETLKKWMRAGLVKGKQTPTRYWMIDEDDVRRVYKESRPR